MGLGDGRKWNQVEKIRTAWVKPPAQTYKKLLRGSLTVASSLDLSAHPRHPETQCRVRSSEGDFILRIS